MNMLSVPQAAKAMNKQITCRCNAHPFPHRRAGYCDLEHVVREELREEFRDSERHALAAEWTAERDSWLAERSEK